MKLLLESIRIKGCGACALVGQCTCLLATLMAWNAGSDASHGCCPLRRPPHDAIPRRLLWKGAGGLNVAVAGPERPPLLFPVDCPQGGGCGAACRQGAAGHHDAMVATRATKGCSRGCCPCAARPTHLVCGWDGGLSIGIACALPPVLQPQGRDQPPSMGLKCSLRGCFAAPLLRAGRRPRPGCYAAAQVVLMWCPHAPDFVFVAGSHAALGVIKEDVGVLYAGGVILIMPRPIVATSTLLIIEIGIHSKVSVFPLMFCRWDQFLP